MINFYSDPIFKNIALKLTELPPPPFHTFLPEPGGYNVWVLSKIYNIPKPINSGEPVETDSEPTYDYGISRRPIIDEHYETYLGVFDKDWVEGLKTEDIENYIKKNIDREKINKKDIVIEEKIIRTKSFYQNYYVFHTYTYVLCDKEIPLILGRGNDGNEEMSGRWDEVLVCDLKHTKNYDPYKKYFRYKVDQLSTYSAPELGDEIIGPNEEERKRLLKEFIDAITK